MLVPIKWLKDYVDINEKLKVFTDRLSETGSHVDSVYTYTSDIKNIKVGLVKSIRKHENADRLFVLDIKTDKDLTIVTAAKNVKENDKVLVAEVGCVFDNGNKIENHDFMGITSEGMLVSYMELGYPDSVIAKKYKDGVIILDDNFKCAESLNDVLFSNTEIIEFEITPNRPDCLSIIGMARETAASFERKIKYPENEYNGIDESIKNYVKNAKIESDNCNRLVLRVAKNVVVKESDQWLKNYLMLAGMRPVNNIVDITNFVMLEYGQPLHAYDLDRLNEQTLIARDAKDKEIIKTLDSEKRELNDSMLVISDSKEALGIAGIMGSYNSEVSEDTKTILLESANFDKDSIRKTSKLLGLRSEASMRNEKGIAVELAEIASKRAMYLIEKMANASVLKESIDLGKKESDEIVVDLRINRLNKLLGSNISYKEAAKYLKLLELEIVKENEEVISVKIPYFRSDITIEADLIEEIARLYGLKNIEDKPLVSSLKQGKKDEMRLLIDDLKFSLYGQKYSEISTYSFVSPKIFDNLMIDKDSKLRDVSTIINPLGEDFSIMRSTLQANILDVISKNLKRKQDDLRLFEIGTVFEKTEDILPKEKKNLVMGLYGHYDFYDLKEMFIKVMKSVGFEDFEFKKETENKTFHKGRCANIIFEGKKVGIIGQISYELRDNFDIKKGAYILEITLDDIIAKRKLVHKYVKLPKYPAIEFDLSFVCDRNVESKTIEDIMKENGGNLLKNIELFDIYTGDQIQEDKKSVSYKLTFRSDEKTLNDNQINPIIEKIVSELENMEVNLRS
ncbi:MAG: phenylalanine--tRNA ligase subunit beta [Tissierellia bacterium]|nr:phenylalanine--tRNA ligase subunit beta [Tissierellia bacterium]